MAFVLIDLDAMAALIKDLKNANADSLGAALDLKDKAVQAGVSTSELDMWTGGLSAQELEDLTTWCVRALALAQLIAAAEPNFFVGMPVSFDDSDVSSLSRSEAEALARGLAYRLANGGLDDNDWDVLVRNQSDPYFAAALMNSTTPSVLADVAQRLSDEFAQGGDQEVFSQRLSALGGALGAASRSRMLGGGFAGMVVDVLEGSGSAPAALSVVLSYATCDPGFARTIAEQVYNYETGVEFPGTWSQGVADGTWFTMPDGSLRTDVMAGVMAMLGRSPQAAQEFFTQGGSSTISIDGYEVTVNDRMQYLIASRIWATEWGSDEGAGLGAALEAAAGFSADGKAVASQACAIADAEERHRRGWHPSANMVDSLDRLADVNPDLSRGYLSLDQILVQDQVVDDTLLFHWEANWPISLVMDPIDQVTQTEADLINGMAWWNLPDFRYAHDWAFNEADARFPPDENGYTQNDNHNDAFRHAYWNALMTSHIGEEFAAKYGTAHEGLPDNQAVREAMDLFNNGVGRRIAAENPHASDEELADLVQQAVNDGDMVVVDQNGNLAWSNQVAQGQCGMVPASQPGMPGRPRGDFEVVTES